MVTVFSATSGCSVTCMLGPVPQQYGAELHWCTLCRVHCTLVYTVQGILGHLHAMLAQMLLNIVALCSLLVSYEQCHTKSRGIHVRSMTNDWRLPNIETQIYVHSDLPGNCL